MFNIKDLRSIYWRIYHVDSEVEDIAFKLFAEHKPNSSIMSITHRLSTIKYVDKVIFIENGKISGLGTHDELLSSHSKYKKYIELQATYSN